MTLYTILRREDEVAWEIYGEEIEASSAGRAIRSLADIPEGIFVAIPSRSWKPLRVTVQQKQTVTVQWAKEES